MLKITITDTETGEIITREGSFAMVHVATESGVENVTHGSGKVIADDVLYCLMGHDFIRDKLFRDAPRLHFLYLARDLHLKQGAVIDRAELERQMKGGGSE